MSSRISRRHVLQFAAAATLARCAPRAAAAEPAPPSSVEELWADFDPRRDPLETEVIREWREGGGVFRHVRFLVGTFKNRPARMTAIYGFPESPSGKLPAILHVHGGGQRAFFHEVQFQVARGYAALSINWGGSGTGRPPVNAVDGARPDDPNTDWGAVDPTQTNVPGYQSILPGPKQLFEDRPDPKNNNWYLLALAARRGLTFLESQAEVDADRLGVHGYSMGGNITMYVAGTDRRVKAAVPAVGGAGWRWERHAFAGERGRPQDSIAGDVDVFRRTLSFESYAPLIRCPLLHRSSTNDFHGWMDDVYRTNRLVPDQPLRYSWAPHLNHRLTPEVEVTLPLWFDHFLRGGPGLPATPRTELVLDAADRVPRLRVVPDRAWPVVRCEVYYSIDPDPRARFWRSADATAAGDSFEAPLPLHSLDAPLFAFANVYQELPAPISLRPLPGAGPPVREVCLSSEFHQATSERLRAADVRATLVPGPLVDDFARGLRDWYQLNAGHASLVQTWTRKLADPAWRGPAGARLELTLRLPRPNPLWFVIHENEWRDYRGPRRTYVCRREISGGDEPILVTFAPEDFRSTADEAPLRSWDHVDQFGVCARYADRASPAEEPKWDGPAASLVRLAWR